MEFTLASESTARTWLKKYNNDINTAVESYLLKHLKAMPALKPKNAGALEAIFKNYVDESSGKIELEGTVQYLEDLGYSAEDITALILAKTLESPSTGVFEHDKFVRNWLALGVSNIQEMKEYLEKMRSVLDTDLDYLRELYQFTFTFSLEPRQRQLSNEDAVTYWRFLLADKYPREVGLWTKFIEQVWGKSVSKDSWNMFFPFLQTFKEDPNLENYDEMASWPSIIDEFVEWFKESGLQDQ